MSDITPLDYAAAGVDTAAGDRAVDLMKAAVSRTHDATVLGATGGFAGMVDASALLGMERPLLATSTDGVGTKIAIARAMDIHDTIGQDLVGMVVDDIVVTGARPVLMTDYIACGRVVPERIAAIVTGIARACEATGTPLVGGETAEHPGVMDPDDYDIAGAATGVVDASKLLGPERVEDGDVLVAMASSGLHSNGYSLVRSVLARTGRSLDSHVDRFGRTLGEELLEPTRLYTRLCLDLVDRVGVGGEGSPAVGVHAFSHVTGGGLGANLSRVLPVGAVGDVDRGSWEVPGVFDWVRLGGSVSWEAMEDSLNLGVGMVAVVGSDSVDEVVAACARAGVDAWVLGSVSMGPRGEVGRRGPAADARRPGERLIHGTKGVTAGAVLLHGRYRTA
ncbi:phosphoribosylformylglycinamidine cyclo-ligase [Actinomyces sp. B33]|uniref:phosphoribosylformylglycinamidine cyclo-ligase n=1 Tax=Actinomyces sp. B33 TaxID=2942131 RepID=UPI002341F839|nr:phosphoribosylformylglycinamidine cyclo-ligase [Actinomyces sp. B33]MDC4233477.1 phosphoribosylformylglycinamidine cyclo-ligase [Actinomyces sp. B33]